MVERPTQVWCSAITSVPMPVGFMDLVVLDWFSRYVLAWALATRVEVGCCLVAVERALTRRQPESFTSEQGGPFTSPAVTGRLEQTQVRIRRDGRGRPFANIFGERRWRPVK